MSKASLEPSSIENRLDLSGQLDFKSISGLRNALAPYLRKSRHLVIDLNGVDRTNSAALALLLQWLEDALDQGCRLEYTNLPDKLVDIAELHGLKGLLPMR